MEGSWNVKSHQMKYHEPKDSNGRVGVTPHRRGRVWEETRCHVELDSLRFMTTMMEDSMTSQT